MKMKKMAMMLLSAAFVIGAAATATACFNFGADSSSSSIAEKTSATVKFDVNTDWETNSIKDKSVTVGKRVSKPKAYITEENPDNLQVYGWYTDAACTNQWDFKKDRVEGDMTLYAKWVELYEVNYYLNGALVKTESVFDGDYIVEDATIADGYKYLGSYVDMAHQTKFDYTQAIAGNTNVYIQRSGGIYLSDHVEEGELQSGGLSNYLAVYMGTAGELDEEGWVDEYTVTTNYADGEKEEKCTYVNFGYMPTYGDGFVELCIPLDISDSQIVRVWFKNLGPADEMGAYFTTMLDVENNVYSETGPIYTEEFCAPKIALTAEQQNMDETAEWTYVDFDLSAIYKNGYSIWGTSPYLGALRIQATYKNDPENPDDWSNEFLIKAIEGVAEEIIVEDGEVVKAELEKASFVGETELNEISAAQTENPQGFVFPKDRACVDNIKGNASIIDTVEGVLFYSENEVLGRELEDPSTGFTVYAPNGKYIDLGTYTTLELTLRNFGFADQLTLSVYNNEGVPVKTTVEIGTCMLESKTYTINLYGAFGMTGSLAYVEVLFNSVGVDNLLLFESIGFGDFVPYDIAGINLNDKFNYGFTSTQKIGVEFDADREGTMFEVAQSGASIVTPDKTYKATTDGYAYGILHYYLPKNSSITAVTVEYKVNGEFTTPYTYALDTAEKGKAKTVSLPFVMEERGFVEGLKLTFEGTGKVLIKEIQYAVGETGLPYYESYEAIYRGWADWCSTGVYEYDDAMEASIFTKKASDPINASMYIGITANHNNVTAPHSTSNIPVTGKTILKIVYQNRTEVDKIAVCVRFDKTTTGAGDESPFEQLNAYSQQIDSNMAEYEWSTLTIEIPQEWENIGAYLSKINFSFEGHSIAIRAMSIEQPSVMA